MRQTRLLALPLLAFVSLAACEESQTSAELKQISIELDSLAAAGSQAPTLELQNKTYSSVASDARRLASNVSGGEKVAAQLLIARAENGLAEVRYAQGAEAARQARSLLNEASSALSIWISVNADAQALTAYDPSAELARIRSEIPAKEQELASAKSELAAHDAELAQLDAQASDLEQQAGLLRDEQTQIETRAMSAGEVEAAELAEQRREVSRRADKLEADSARLRAQAAVSQRGRQTLELTVSQREGQLALLESAVNDLSARQALAQEEANRLIESGASAVTRLVEAIEEAGKIHTEQTVPALAEAEEAFGRARSAASQARSSDRQSAGVQIASATHGRAGAALTLAEAIADRLTTLETIVAVEPGIPGRNELTDELLALRETAETARNQAVEAYRETLDAIDGIGARDESDQASIERAIANLYSVLGEEPPTDEFADDSFDAPLSSSDAGALPQTVEELLEAVREMVQESDFSQARALIRAEQEPGTSLLAGVDQIIASYTELDNAVIEAFGTSLADLSAGQEQAASLPGVPSPADLAEELDIESLVINYEGDDVALISDPEAGELDGVYVSYNGSSWAVDLDRMLGSLEAEESQMLDAISPLLPTVAETFAALAQETLDGSYGSAEEVSAAMQQRLLPVIFGAMGQLQFEESLPEGDDEPG